MLVDGQNDASIRLVSMRSREMFEPPPLSVDRQMMAQSLFEEAKNVRKQCFNVYKK
jgi:hypothetical protein